MTREATMRMAKAQTEELNRRLAAAGLASRVEFTEDGTEWLRRAATDDAGAVDDVLISRFCGVVDGDGRLGFMPF